MDHDFSSYVLFNKYNVLASDFFELAMGYDWRNNSFDKNGNGKADDWVPPSPTTPVGTWQYAMNWYNELGNTKPMLFGWGNDYVNSRLYWHPTNNNHPDNGKVIWSDSRQLVAKTDTKIEIGEDFLEGAPPIINLIDFLLWSSKALGSPSSEDIFNWLEGKLPNGAYVIQNPQSPDTVMAPNPKATYRCGMGLQKVWETLEKGSFNFTGFVNWLENTRKVNVWGLFEEMNNYHESYSDSPDPYGFLHYMMNPNYVYAPNGNSRGWMYHGSIGGTTGTIEQQTERARDYIWLLINGSYWDELGFLGKNYWKNVETSPLNTLPGIIFMKLREMELGQINDGKTGKNLTFNVFQMMQNLGIKPEEWLLAIEAQGVLPFELLAVVDSLNYNKLFQDARDTNKKTRMKINGTFGFEISNFKLATGFHSGKLISYEVAPSDFYANNQLENFWNVREFSTTSGTLALL
jgi:hypothetical protein